MQSSIKVIKMTSKEEENTIKISSNEEENTIKISSNIEEYYNLYIFPNICKNSNKDNELFKEDFIEIIRKIIEKLKQIHNMFCKNTIKPYVSYELFYNIFESKFFKNIFTEIINHSDIIGIPSVLDNFIEIKPIIKLTSKYSTHHSNIFPISKNAKMDEVMNPLFFVIEYIGRYLEYVLFYSKPINKPFNRIFLRKTTYSGKKNNIFVSIEYTFTKNFYETFCLK